MPPVHSSDAIFRLPSPTSQASHRLEPSDTTSEQTSGQFQGKMTFTVVSIYFYPLNMYKMVLLFLLGFYLISDMSQMMFLSLVHLSMMIFRKIYVTF